jgi:adenine-specific DNA-methyltransferase
MEKLDGKSMNIVAGNIYTIKKSFPEVFCEDKIDFERLQEVLGEYVEDKEERYSFNWKGKSKAIRIVQTPSTGTLRPAKEESKNFDTTENLYIEGDNLEVLKLLQKTYQSKVKMIYIDPPYNTGNDFVYPDDFRNNIKNYLKITGQVDEEGKKIGTNSDASGRYHTDWLNMIYPRLKLARNLLTDDGVIFVSIDEHELTNLRFILMEIFGEENWIADIVWQGGSKNDEQYFAISHEYILVFAKSRSNLSIKSGKWEEPKEGIQEIYDAYESIKRNYPFDYKKQTQALKSWYSSLENGNSSKDHAHYSWVDKRGIYFPDNLSGPRFGQYRYDVIHPITKKICKEPSRGWVYPEKVMQQKIEEEDLIHFGEDETTVPCRKTYLKDHETKRPRSVIYKDGRAASSIVKNLFGQPKVFTNPKDHEVLGKFIELCTNESDIILDCFAGSSSTAHAIFELNLAKKEDLRFVLVQFPEPCDKNSEAYKAGYKNICEIGKERIRRAGEKILEENKDKEGIEDLDIGFKVFKLDSSNIKKWDADSDNLEINMDNMIDNFVPDRTEEDIVYEIMLKYGIDLTYPVEMRKIEDKKVFSIGFGALFICIDDDITLEVVEGIVKFKDELKPETTRIVFKDNGFKNDSVKTNAIQILRRNKIEEIMSI